MVQWRGPHPGPAALIKAMVKLQSQSTSGPNSFAQKGAIAALKGSQQCVADMCRAFERRRDLVGRGRQRPAVDGRGDSDRGLGE
jgi:aspartate aminotransferase